MAASVGQAFTPFAANTVESALALMSRGALPVNSQVMLGGVPAPLMAAMSAGVNSPLNAAAGGVNAVANGPAAGPANAFGVAGGGAVGGLAISPAIPDNALPALIAPAG